VANGAGDYSRPFGEISRTDRPGNSKKHQEGSEKTKQQHLEIRRLVILYVAPPELELLYTLD
jgi:hypothetical protein